MRSRVIISNVKPGTCGEDFYFKRTPGEQVHVSADIFADSEEPVQASLLFKHQSEKKWQETPLQSLGDDAWAGIFTVEKKGFYQFRIEGWVEGQKQFATATKEHWQVRVGRKQEIFSTWYEMFPRSASPVPGKHGTFQDVENLLPRLAEMGFDVLLFPPIFPIGKTGRKGKDNASTVQPDDVGAPWAVGSEMGGHTTIHPELGTMADFEQLMKAASGKGIEIALDLALRCSADHPYVKEHPEWFHRTPDGKVIIEEKPPISYGDSVNFDICCDDWENLWQELKNNLIFWAEKGVRIFYGSAPHYKPFSFLKWLIAEVQKVYPDVIFVSGAITKSKVAQELAKCGFAQSFTHFMWKNTAEELQQHLLELNSGISREILRPNFFTNTIDVLPTSLQAASENAFLLRYALAATLSSNCGIYGPIFELMENNPRLEDTEKYLRSEKYEIRWHDWSARNRLTDFIARLNRIRHDNTALQDTFNIIFPRTDNGKLLSYVKYTPDKRNIIWCIVNLDPYNKQSGFIEVPKELLGLRSRWFNLRLDELLSGETYNWFNDWNFVELKPERFPLHVLRIEI